MKTRQLLSRGCWIHGREVHNGSWWRVVDPSTGEAFARTTVADEQLVDQALASARSSFDPWRSLPTAQRAELLLRLADRIRSECDPLAAILSREVGKPLEAARAEVENAASLIDFFVQEALRLTGHMPLLGHPREQVMVTREPVGVVAAITPFNYPLSTLCCKMGPALAVGCTVVAKPDEHTPLSTLECACMAHSVGIPPGVFNVVTGPGGQTGRFLVDNPGPDLVAFTGSTEVGREIQKLNARWVRRSVLELGGNCPAILCADAPWPDLLPEIVAQCFKNSGQYCYRISRIYVAEEIHQEFLARLTALSSALKVGPPTDPQSDLGPLNHPEILARVKEQVEAAVEAGARIACGGQTAADFPPGCYYPPTVLSHVKPEMAIMQQEVFGPVVTVRPFRDLDAALAEANGTPYGLAAYVFTADTATALACAERLEVGSVWINRIHQAYAEAPFGGRKRSGIGREKSRFGLEEYTELKTIYFSY